MADPAIENWKLRGSISLWHYEGFPQNYHGYHLTADREGCDFLIGLLRRFRDAKYPARKRFSLQIPTAQELGVPNCQEKCISAKEVELRYRRDDAPNAWSISQSEGLVRIEMGCERLDELLRGVSDIANGEGDWSMGEGEGALWFWWRL